MGTCRCGGKTIKFPKKAVAKKSIPKKQIPKKSGNAKDLSARSKRLSAQATKKAKKAATPCNCTQ